MITPFDSAPIRKYPDRFLVAFSLAGEQKELVAGIAEAVELRLGWGTVFLYEWFESDLAGSAGDLKLQDIYAKHSDLVVICASAEYGAKVWTLVEWDAIRARHNHLRADPDRSAADRILPLRVADGDVAGLLDNAIWVDARQRTVDYIARLLVRRLKKFLPHADKPYVFLAETTAELEDENKPINRQRMQTFLEEECGVQVLPQASLVDLPYERYRSALKADLRRSLAFVQLLSERPWREGRFDQIQHSTAEQTQCPMFRFRGELDLERIEKTSPQHRKFLEANGSIAGSFEDFKQHVAGKLKDAQAETFRNIRQMQEEEKRSRLGAPSGDACSSNSVPPLVRVAVRAAQVDSLWASVFKFLVEHEKIDLDELAPGESFVDLQEMEPCHGFLILCDGDAQVNASLSPREALRQCRLIQLRMESSLRLPPVALAYWPPPNPEWSQLLKCTPRSLHRVIGDTLEVDLKAFVCQVRQVRSDLP